MQFGFNLPISGPVLSPEHITRLAREGEAMGFDFLTLTDHVLLPDMSAPWLPLHCVRRVHVRGTDTAARTGCGRIFHRREDVTGTDRVGGDWWYRIVLR